MKLKSILIGLGMLVMLASCREQPITPTPVPPPPRVNTSDAQMLHRMSLTVQTAQSPAAEADAIKRLRQWISDQGMTYALQTFRIDNDAPIASPTLHNGPVNTQVEVYRGREHVYRFNFVPQDNRNLALMLP